MPTVKPFRALRPKSSEAAQIAAPPYDVLSSDEARAMAAGQPLSFLHVSKPEIDLPAGVNVHSPEVYAKGGDNFKKLMAEGHLARDKQESFYLYRQSAGGHSQTGLVAVVSCEDYRSGRIKKHEFTQPEKEDDRVRHLEALGAQTGPAFLAYRSDPKLDGILAEQAKLEPWADFTAPDGVRHTCWSVESQHAARAIAEGFGALPTFYIADGHHRSAAAFRLSEKMSSSVPNSLGDEPFRFFLAVIFPHHQLRILAYNRLVKDLRGLSPKAFLEKLRDLGELQPAASPIPDAPQSMAVFVAGKWYRF
ncbi:MAG: DUF1015 domain-containing protein, partial [Verrucomicrobiae bacterium]|nr:DUF1015 domain-containing protein [Verrucomicrobiae bacterium]